MLPKLCCLSRLFHHRNSQILKILNSPTSALSTATKTAETTDLKTDVNVKPKIRARYEFGEGYEPKMYSELLGTTIERPSYTREAFEQIEIEIAEKNAQLDQQAVSVPSKADVLARTSDAFLPLPNELLIRINSLLKGMEYPKAHGEHLVEHPFAERLRAGSGADYDVKEGLKFLSNEFPISYAAIRRVLVELKTRLPDFEPKNMIDFGSGPATATWAAREVFESIKSASAIERSNVMYKIGKNLNDNDEFPINWRKDVDNDSVAAQIGVCAFSLSENLNPDERDAILTKMWEKSKNVLILIEAGTLEGSEIIRRGRDFLVTNFPATKDQPGAYVIAPCPHDDQCPMIDEHRKRWCQFPQRISIDGVPRGSKLRGASRTLTRKVKEVQHASQGKPLGKVTSKTVSIERYEQLFTFSYVVLCKGINPRSTDEESLVETGFVPEKMQSQDPDSLENPVDYVHNWPRIVGPPQKRGRHVNLYLCTEDNGLERRTITKKMGKKLYKTARKCKWGDLWQFPRTKKLVHHSVEASEDEEPLYLHMEVLGDPGK